MVQIERLKTLWNTLRGMEPRYSLDDHMPVANDLL